MKKPTFRPHMTGPWLAETVRDKFHGWLSFGFAMTAAHGAGRRSGQGQGDDGGGDDVVNLGAARQVGDRFGEALEDRSNGGGAG